MRMTMTATFREHTKKETNDILIFDNNKGTLRNVITWNDEYKDKGQGWWGWQRHSENTLED